MNIKIKISYKNILYEEYFKNFEGIAFHSKLQYNTNTISQ